MHENLVAGIVFLCMAYCYWATLKKKFVIRKINN